MKIRSDNWLFSRLRAWISNLCLRLLPNGRFGDRVYSFLLFVASQGRLPRGRYEGFVDYLYDMKVREELLSLPRQMVSDKEYGKFFINSVLGGDYAVPTIAVLRCKEEIDEQSFATDCVIKPTNANGLMIIRRNNEPIDLDTVRTFFECDFYRIGREPNYRFLEKKVIVEPIVFDGKEFIELRVHCYKGRAKILSVTCENGNARERRDRNWQPVDLKFNKPKPRTPVPKPEAWESILWAVETLAARFEYIRVDVYTTGKEFLIGELTNCHTNARTRFKRDGDEAKFTRLLFGDRRG